MVNSVTVKISMLDMGMKDTVLSVDMDADKEACPSSSSTAAVKEIFNHVTAKWGGSIISTKAAREEALSTLSSTHLANYSKLSKGPGPSTSLQKTRRDTSSSQPTGSQAKWSTASGASFHVASVGMIICGVDVFDYLDMERSRNASSSQSAGQDEKPVWRLLNKSGQVLTVINIVCPTGTDLAKHKGWDKVSITESHLWFVTRNHIPDTVYESWNTQPIIAGSDFEGDSDNSELFSDVDSIRDDADHNPELASSLMEMDLSDSGDIHTDYKGKGKQRILKTPAVNAKWTHTALSPDESPMNQRVVVKRLKSETTAIPHFLSMESPPLSQLRLPSAPAACTIPELSYPVTIVSVSDNDILWRHQPQPNDPFALAMINPWESEYVIRPVHYLV
ncbi:hypothetical protein BD769DRAFT_1669831 [Suillus cothurnatus]|nr:hypothetical protein BD769DRAFT_1669831 [Suillus cothurnatus]